MASSGSLCFQNHHYFLAHEWIIIIIINYYHTLPESEQRMKRDHILFCIPPGDKTLEGA